MTSEYLDRWIGNWTVELNDGSTESWEITHTWVSNTGKSHIAYGVKQPGSIEFQIYFGTMFNKHSYVETGHKTEVTELPMEFTEYTDLVPSEDFDSFTAKPGKYSIKSGVREGLDLQQPSVTEMHEAVGEAEAAQSGPAEPLKLEIDTAPGEALTDIDGNVYRTVQIGSQVWMAENLRTKTYRNGTAIARPGSDNDAWERNSDGAYSFHDNDPANESFYGLLYNWAAVTSPDGLAPEGWHVPTDDEWQTLVDYLGGGELAGGPMKSIEVDPAPHPRWDRPNTGATDISGFAGVPAGLRRSNGTFREIGPYGAWWSSTDGGKDDAWHRSIFFSDTKVYHFIYGKGSGMSIRCVKD